MVQYNEKDYFELQILQNCSKTKCVVLDDNKSVLNDEGELWLATSFPAYLEGTPVSSKLCQTSSIGLNIDHIRADPNSTTFASHTNEWSLALKGVELVWVSVRTRRRLNQDYFDC